MKNHSWLFLVTFSAMCLAACGGSPDSHGTTPDPTTAQADAGTDSAPIGCSSDKECPGNFICDQGTCTSPSHPPPIGCTKDTECKGNRICVNGDCVDPTPPSQDAGTTDATPADDAQADAATADAGPQPDPCANANCPIATHCEVKDFGYVCAVDLTATAFDCPIPPLTADPVTDAFVVKRRFMLPDDATPNNNGYVGPFCCTGRTAEFKDIQADDIAYAYYYGWEHQAYNHDLTSYTQDVSVSVAASFLKTPTTFDTDTFHFSVEELASCTSKWLRVGSYIMTMYPKHVDVLRLVCFNFDPGFDMGTVSMAIDIQYDGP